jgi:ABC-2 type transport system ATP-binding protein
MITINNLTFAYGSEPIFTDQSFTIKPHKITIVLGKNGTGKTTLFHLIADILKPDFGSIKVDSEIVFIPDEPLLYPYLTGYEYLEFIKILSHHQLSDQVVDLASILELKPHLSKLIHEMSLGMKHKLALMSALLLNYHTYLIDEPLTALDPPTQKFMISFFKNMKNDQKTLIISTHMMQTAYELADDLIILGDKKIHFIENDFDSYQSFEKTVLTYFD